MTLSYKFLQGDPPVVMVAVVVVEKEDFPEVYIGLHVTVCCHSFSYNQSYLNMLYPG